MFETERVINLTVTLYRRAFQKLGLPADAIYDGSLFTTQRTKSALRTQWT